MVRNKYILSFSIYSVINVQDCLFQKITSFQYFNWIIAHASLKTRLSLHQDLESIQEITARGAVVFQSPRVKSGNSTGMPPWAMEWAVSGSREDQAAPS